VRGHLPQRIGIVVTHFLRRLCCIWTKVLLINASLLIDDEGHDTRLTVFRRPCDHRESADHISVDDIVVFAAGGVLPLASEYLEIVAMEGLWSGVRVGFFTEIALFL